MAQVLTEDPAEGRHQSWPSPESPLRPVCHSHNPLASQLRLKAPQCRSQRESGEVTDSTSEKERRSLGALTVGIEYGVPEGLELSLFSLR